MEDGKVTKLRVDLSKRLGEVTQLASGTLYGVIEESPGDEHIALLRPRVLGNSPEAGHQQPLGAAIPVAKRVAATGGRVQVRLAEWYKGWYNFGGLKDWYEKLELIVKRIKEEGITNIDGYEIWNEPDSSWKGEFILPIDDAKPFFIAFHQINVPQAGDYKLTLRYANGNDAKMKLKVLVNNADLYDFTLPVTGGWVKTGSVGEAVLVVRLAQGINRIKFTKEMPGDLQIDYLEVAGATPERYDAGWGTIRGNGMLYASGYASSPQTEGMTFNEFYSRSQKKLKELDSEARVIGPAIFSYIHDAMKNFLLYQRDHGTVPDIICWHQLSDDNFTANYEDYRQIEKELGIEPRPITINEYSGGGWFDEEACPGANAALIAKFERLGIDSACQTYWNANQGTLSSSLTDDGKPNGGYWFFKWYADLAGEMAATVPEDVYDPRKLDGFAGIDDENEVADVIFGGENAGAVEVSIENIPDYFGDQVTVLIERTPFKDRFTAVDKTEVLREEVCRLTDRGLKLTLADTNDHDGYRISLRTRREN